MMRSDLIVLPEPGIDCDLSLFGGVEPFRVEHFSSKCSVEAFVVSILPGTSGIDLDGLDAGLLEPGLEVSGDELWSVVGSKVFWLSHV